MGKFHLTLYILFTYLDVDDIIDICIFSTTDPKPLKHTWLIRGHHLMVLPPQYGPLFVWLLVEKHWQELGNPHVQQTIHWFVCLPYYIATCHAKKRGFCLLFFSVSIRIHQWSHPVKAAAQEMDRANNLEDPWAWRRKESWAFLFHKEQSETEFRVDPCFVPSFFRRKWGWIV